MIEIKRNGDIFFAIEDICEGSKFSRQLMDHHYIILKFSTEEPVYFEIGDSVEIPGFGYYELTSAYFPKYNEETDGYDYEMQMDAYYMSWKNKICKYRPKFGANETSFKLTTTVDVHLNVILGNLKALGLKYNGKDFSVDYTTYNKDVFDIQKRFFVSYDSISIIEALNSICSEDALDCEWWIDGSIIYLGYCEMVGQVTFEHGVNMLTMSQSESKSSFITRLYAFGSDKNIPPGYFTGSDADVTTDGVATDYLMLPNKEVDKEGFFCKNGYLENVNVVKNDKQAIEGVVMFDDEYPKVSCAVSGIKTYDSTVKNDDGTNTTETFWQVTSTDTFATNFKTDWIKRNLTLMIKFESGALLGMEFEVNFKIIDNKNYFEIVANEDYGRKLPDKVMCPKIGDKFFLYNWDATKVTETNLIQEAQESLFERAKTYYNKSMIDNSNFSCVMDGKKFFNYGTFDYHPLGEQVKLISPMFADIDENGKHYRNSRIIGIEINLDIPYDSPEYTIGEKASYSRLGQLEDKVDSITVNGLQIGGDGNGGKGVYVIGMNDSTPESDSNVYSSRRTRYSFLSKLNDDTAQGLITFLKGLKSQDVIKAINGLSLGNGENYVNGNGDAKLSDVIVDRLHDKNSTPSDRVIIGAQGFDLYMGDDGKSHLYVDYLTARTRMFASSVEIRKVSYSGGTTIFSNAGSQIAKVSYIYDAAKEKVIAYKCYAFADDGTTKTMNWWHVGMMALCQTFNVKAGELEKLENRYYWRLVVGVGQEKIEGKLYDYVVLSNLQTFHGNDNVIPYSNTGAQFGNGFPIAFGATLVNTTGDMEMKSLAYICQDQEGKTTDDSNTAIADRVFYGYETVDGDSEPDAPQAYDVIVQAGDQIEWKKYGNVIKLSTSTEDNATDNAPAITMYHKMGAPNATGDTENGNPVINPYLWRTVTAVISPEIVMYNTDIYKLFQGTPDNIVDPIVVIFDIIPSAQYITRHPVSRTTTPSNITFRVRRRTGNAVDYIDNAKIYACINGSEEGTLLSTKQLSDLGTIYDMNSVSLYATVNAVEAGKPYDKRVAELDIPVLTDGDKGIDGTDALEVTIKNAPLVFDTNDNGVVSSSAVQTAEIWIAREGKNVIADIKQPSITGSLNFTIGSDNAVIRKTSECLQIILKGIGIAKESVNGNYVSKTSGYVVVSFNDGTNPFQRQILFNVNVARFNSSVIQTAKLYERKYTEVSNKYDALPEEVRNKESFTEYNSAIKQTARGISLSVTEQAAKKRNLLINSDFARNEGFYFPKLASRAIIERLSGYEGENCVHTFASTVAEIPVLTWGGNGNVSPNIPIIVGKKYTISCWVKVSNLSSVLCIKVFKQQSLTDSVGTDTMLDTQYPLDAKNTWQLVTTTFEASGDYSYASVSIFVRPTANSRVDSYICRPMLEQADSYNGWTLAEEDYVYRNGNMLDNTRYLNTGGNLITVGTIYNNVKDNCSMSEASVDMVTTERRTGTLLRYKLPLEAYTDYVLSFYIRSKDIDSKQNVICTIIQDSGVFFAEALMQKEKETVGILSNYTSLNGNTTTSGYVSFSSIPTEWTKVSYHFSLNTKNTAQSISILAYAQNGAGTLQICQPKLEKAVTNTAWTEAKQDVAFKDKYKRAGIDFDSETIRLSAERTIIDGDMYLKGILIENTAEPVKADFFPIVCDLKQNKSIAVGTYTGTENYGTGSENKFVVLPMFDDTSCINENGEETIVAGLKESGVKLSIFSKYNPNVAKWATAKRYRYLDTAEVFGMPPYQILHAAITVVYADPRIAFKKNYYDFTNEIDGTTSVSATIKPQGDGTPSYNANQGYKHGCFVCNGRRGRMLLLMPGQTLHITSSVEKWGGEDVLMWYIDNASEFVPVSKQVIFERDNNQKDYTYTWVNLGYTNSDQSNDSSFPGDFVNNDTNLVYEDVLFAPPQLSRDYPASDEWGMDKVQSVEALTIPLF